MVTSQDKEKQEALAEWRKDNWKQIFDSNKKVLDEILNNPETSSRDRIEAAKTLARMVDGLSAEKIITAKEKLAEQDRKLPELTDKEKEEYRRILGT
jgi:hypothetical protein